jgi:hypothetical protein
VTHAQAGRFELSPTLQSSGHILFSSNNSLYHGTAQMPVACGVWQLDNLALKDQTALWNCSQHPKHFFCRDTRTHSWSHPSSHWPLTLCSTQDKPAFCGLASIAMVLIALSIDPIRLLVVSQNAQAISHIISLAYHAVQYAR